jgi:hypothetical protein
MKVGRYEGEKVGMYEGKKIQNMKQKISTSHSDRNRAHLPTFPLSHFPTFPPTRKGLEAGEKIILVDGIERKTGQRGPGHHVINRGTVGNQQAGKTGHGHLHA